MEKTRFCTKFSDTDGFWYLLYVDAFDSKDAFEVAQDAVARAFRWEKIEIVPESWTIYPQMFNSHLCIPGRIECLTVDERMVM